MAEYISRSYIRKMAMLESEYTMDTEQDKARLLKIIEDAPAADVAPVRHGRWVSVYNPDIDGRVYACSECAAVDRNSKKKSAIRFCWNCGAKMKED